MKRYLLLLIIVAWSSSLFCSNAYEIRAVWLTTNWRLDWPSRIATDEKSRLQQQAELCRLLDKIRDANMNVVFFQARVRGEVLYESEYEPWSGFLTGRHGKSPGYDPLAFAVQECHKRGLQCHAWLVCMPLGSEKQVRGFGEKTVVKKHPGWVTRHQGEYFLEPSKPEVARYLGSIAAEITCKYDIDGIHLDYIRYPDHVKGYPDAAFYKRSGTSLSLEDWRRENISRIVYSVYDRVKELKPWVKVSSSPLGRYRDLPGMKYYGWNAYGSVFQDAQRWLKEGKHDLLVPMMYYKEELFYPYLKDWVMNSNGRPIVSGLGVYRLDETDANWDLREIENQIVLGRGYGASGQSVYRAGNFVGDKKGVGRLLREDLYNTPVLYPPMDWIDSEPVRQVALPEADLKAERLSWRPVEQAAYYSVYGRRTDRETGCDTLELLEPVVYGTSWDFPKERFFGNISAVAVSASNCYHKEGEISSEVSVRPKKCVYSHGLCEMFSDKGINVLSLEAFNQYERISVTDLYGNTRFLDIHSGNPELPDLTPGFYIIRFITKNNQTENRYILVE